MKRTNVRIPRWKDGGGVDWETGVDVHTPGPKYKTGAAEQREMHLVLCGDLEGEVIRKERGYVYTWH